MAIQKTTQSDGWQFHVEVNPRNTVTIYGHIKLPIVMATIYMLFRRKWVFMPVNVGPHRVSACVLVYLVGTLIYAMKNQHF